jgi:phosphatidylinositol alpha-1,6-mannosyltransferase
MSNPKANRKIGIVSSEFPPNVGGMENYSFYMAKELVRRGYEVHLFVPQNSTDIEDAFSHKILTRNTLIDINKIRRYEMDIWHTINAGYSTLALVKNNVVAHIHGNDFLSPWVGIDGRIIWRFAPKLNPVLMYRGFLKAQRILSNSRFTQSLFLRTYDGQHRLAEKTGVFHVGVSDEYFQGTPEHFGGSNDRGNHNFITVSRLNNRRKNVETVIKATADLISEHSLDINYTIIGDGKQRSRLESLINELGVSNHIFMKGFIGTEEIIENLRNSDLFILVPSSTGKDVEGFGIVYLEANACGIPVLASRNSGTEDALEDGVSGFFVDDSSVEGVKTALLRFMEREVTFTKENILAHARKFTWSAFVDRLEEKVYNEIRNG